MEPPAPLYQHRPAVPGTRILLFIQPASPSPRSILDPGANICCFLTHGCARSGGNATELLPSRACPLTSEADPLLSHGIFRLVELWLPGWWLQA